MEAVCGRLSLSNKSRGIPLQKRNAHGFFIAIGCVITGGSFYSVSKKSHLVLK